MHGEQKDIDALVADAASALKDGNIERLIIIYEGLANHGVPNMLARIGELYETGYKHKSCVFEKNNDLAIKWYLRAIEEENDPLAHLGLGRICCERDPNSLDDILNARKHLQFAYDNNLAQAGIYLGMMSMFGKGVERNLSDAEEYFLRAASAGFPIAYRYLANIAADSGRLLRTIEMLIKEAFFTIKLKMIDRDHPNLWTIKG